MVTGGDACYAPLTGNCMNVVADLQVDAAMNIVAVDNGIKTMYYKGVASILMQ